MQNKFRHELSVRGFCPYILFIYRHNTYIEWWTPLSRRYHQHIPDGRRLKADTIAYGTKVRFFNNNEKNRQLN